MKKFKLLTIILFGIIVLTGCSKNKKAITSSDFNNQAQNQGIIMSDVTSYYGLASKAYQTNTNPDYKVLFIEGNNENDIKNMFLDEGKNFYNKAGIREDSGSSDDSSLTTVKPRKYIVNGKNFESLEIITEYNYYYLIRVDNTILLMESTLENKDKMINLKNSVNY